MDSSKLKLTFLLLIAVLPISLATWYYRAMESGQVGATTNKGELIIPPLDVTALDLRDTSGELVYRSFEEEVAGVDVEEYEPRPWLLVYLGAPDCDAACEERLYYLRQLHTRLGADAPRVRRYYLNLNDEGRMLDMATRARFMEMFPSMGVAHSKPGTVLGNLEGTHDPARNPLAEHFIYVVDPVGNVMLYFTPENTPENILTDLETLLDQTSLG